MKFQPIHFLSIFLIPLIVGQNTVTYPQNDSKGTADLAGSNETAETHEKSKINPIDYFLNGNIFPSRYDITLTPLFLDDHNTFDGIVKITAEVRRSTKEIILHSADLVHNNVSVATKRKDYKVKGVNVMQRYEFLKIEITEDLPAGEEVTIQLWYSGYMANNMQGFFKSSYLNDHRNVTRWLAATSFEPIGARKVFPCFDEPIFKATFKINVVAPPEYEAISNMPLQKRTKYDDGRSLFSFEETPKMSTYLLGIVVSDFEALLNEKEKHTAWARHNIVDHAVYAHKLMTPIVKFFEKTLQQPFDLPKLSMVALPQFPDGMANWGLITLDEMNMISSEKSLLYVEHQNVLNTISREIGNQWFGSLVTPKWWKFLWLKEGLAMYFGYLASSHIEPEWDLELQFVVDQLYAALNADSYSSSHALSKDVYSPPEIKGAFDALVSKKSGSIIRMMEKCFGRDVLYKAIRRFLKAKKANDVAVPTDLFNAFKEEITDVNIKNSIHEIMDSWTNQAGYPVVHVRVTDKAIHLRQNRFLLEKEQDGGFKQIWNIPISWTSESIPDYSNTVPKYWLKKESDSIPLEKHNGELLIFNIQQSGFYRVNYDNDYWKRIIKILKSDQFKTIDEINRASLIDDLMNLGRAGDVDYAMVLSATQYLNKENKYAPFRAFTNNFNYLYNKMQGKDGFEAFLRYGNEILESIAEKISILHKPSDNQLRKVFRTHVNSWLCKIRGEKCIAKFFFNIFKDNLGGVLDTSYRDIVSCYASATNNFRTLNTLWNIYLNTTKNDEQLVLLKSFACMTQQLYIKTLMEKAITPGSEIKHEHSFQFFSAIYDGAPTGVGYLMDFIGENYDKMTEYYGGLSEIKSMLSEISMRLYTPMLYEQYDSLIKWLHDKEPVMRESLKLYKDQADYELSWSKKNIPRIHKWLEQNYPESSIRLPSNMIPRRYDLTLSPHFEGKDFAFTGKVLIEMEVNNTFTSRIVLHSHELDIQNVFVYESKSKGKQSLLENRGDKIKIESYELIEGSQKLSIYMERILGSGKYIAEIDFAGKLNDDLQGFYRSFYYDKMGKIRWIAATHFAPIYARKAFPCFDEPRYKATFAINIERPKEYHVLSNMPLQKSKTSEVKDRILDSFKESLPMSPYLVAFVISDFEPVRNGYQNINVWSRPNISTHGDLAQIAAMRMLEYLNDQTGIKYPLPKMDLVAIPDFGMGAMENWGVITFKESRLIYEEYEATSLQTENIINTIAHELSHMWFGNLVTCDWWEYVWLNEGFAEYFQWHIADIFRPSYKLDELFVVHKLHPTLVLDSHQSSHPINNPVTNNANINDIFDGIAYGKAASLIRMLRKSLPVDLFDKALNKYLNKHKYSSATPSDLWSVLDEVIEEYGGIRGLNDPMEKEMDHWMNKGGYPIVHVSNVYDYIVFNQMRFTTNGQRLEGSYKIPITITLSDNMDFENTTALFWLGSARTHLRANVGDSFYIVNLQQTGFYRVHYDAHSWNRIVEYLFTENYTKIHVSNRAQIVDDLLSLARAGYVDYEFALNATRYLSVETEYPPWKAFFSNMEHLVHFYEEQQNYRNLQKYLERVVDYLYQARSIIVTSGETHAERLTSKLTLQWASRIEYQPFREKSERVFDTWVKKGLNIILPDARPAIYCFIMKRATQEQWDFLYNQYLQTDFDTEKETIVEALGCSKNYLILSRYASMALNKNYTAGFRKHDVPKIFASIYNSGQYGTISVIDYLLNNYEKVYDYYGNWQSVGDLFAKAAARLSRLKHIDKLRKFVNDKEVELAEILPVLQSAVTAAQRNYKWLKDYSPVIDEWLLKNLVF